MVKSKSFPLFIQQEERAKEEEEVGKEQEGW